MKIELITDIISSYESSLNFLIILLYSFLLQILTFDSGFCSNNMFNFILSISSTFFLISSIFSVNIILLFLFVSYKAIKHFNKFSLFSFNFLSSH